MPDLTILTSGQNTSLNVATTNLTLGVSGQAANVALTQSQNLDIQVQGQTVGVLYVTGPKGDTGTGERGPPGSGLISLNGLTGNVVLYGKDNVVVTTAAPSSIYVSTTGLATSGNLSGVSGILSNQIAATGSILYQFYTGVSGGNAVALSGFVTGQLAILSGQISATGHTLYELVTGLSGQSASDYATKNQLTQTGIVLGNQINSLSGFTTGASGYLQSQINAGGQAVQTGALLYNLLTGMSGQAIVDYVTKTQLTQTGVLIENQLNSLSGFVTGTSGYLYNLITGATGFSSSLSGYINQQIAIVSGQIATTGLNLYSLVTGLSGQSSLDYATKNQLTQSGIIIEEQIGSLSGFTSNLSGALESKINLTGQSSVIHANGIGSGLSGALYQTGHNLYALNTGLSGYILGLINATSAGVTALNGASGVLNIYGTGSVYVITQGQNIFVSGNIDPNTYATQAYVTGVSGSLQNKIDLLSGFVTGVSGALQIFINEANVNVDSINGHTGALNLIGTGGLTVISGSPQNILVSGDQSISGYVNDISGILQESINHLLLYNNPLYFSNSQSSVTGHNLMSYNYPTGFVPTTGVYTNVLNGQFLTGFLSPTGQPGLNGFVQGTNVASIHAWISNINQKETTLSYQLFKYTTGGIFENIATSNSANRLTDVQTHYDFSVFVTGVNLNSTDRLAIRWYANTVGGGTDPTIYLTWADDTAAAESLPISAALLGTTYYPLTNPSGFITTGQTGQFYPASNPQQYATSGNLAATGTTLYNLLTGLSGQLTGLSGQLVNDFATKTQLTQTGSILDSKINSLSGYVNNVSGGLENRIFQTGAASIAFSIGGDTNLSGNLGQTGAVLLSVIANTGSQAWNAANNNGINLSGNLASTGTILNNRINALSGYIDQQDYATGRAAILYASGISGILNTIIIATGNSAVAHANGIGINLSGNLTQTGATLDGKINSLSGYVNNQDYATGRAAILYASGASGALETRIAQTGAASINFAIGIGSNLSGNLTLTGQTLINRDNSLSGWADQIFVHRTGNELVSGVKQFVNSPLVTGVQFVGVSGSGFYINAATGGQIQFSSGNNLIMLIDGNQTGSQFAVVDSYEAPIFEVFSDTRVVAGQFLSNALFVSGSGVSFGVDYVSPNRAILVSGDSEFRGNVIVTGNGFAYYLSGQNLFDIFYPRSNPSGYVTGFSLYSTGSLLYNMLTGTSGALVNQIIATGNSAVTHANGIGINLSGNLASTGSALSNRIDSLSGYVNTQDYATGRAAILYASGASGFLVNQIAQTGLGALNFAIGIGVNLSGNLTLTGATLISRENSISGVLQGYINSISAGTGLLLRDVVYTSGTQIISGTKYFVGNTFIDNLFVTGSQTVVNTQDIYVGNNWMVLNATGGARDSAIFISTGFTGMDATGAILGFDVPSNTWVFGIGGYMTDLGTLPKIASLTDIVNASGGLEARIFQTGAAAISYATSVGLIISGNLSQTGATLLSQIAQTGSQSWNAANNNGINLSGNLAQTGLNLYTQIYNTGQIIISASGGLEARITATGNSAVAHANGIGVNLSGNLTLTGQTLQTRIDSLSGYIGLTSGVLNNRLYSTGSSLYTLITGMSGQGTGDFATKAQLTQTGAALGAQISSLSGLFIGFTGGVLSYLTGLLPTGYSQYYINYPVTFPSIPRVNVTMELSGDANGMYGFSISGRSTTGFWTLLTDDIDSSGVFLDVIVKI